MTDNHPITPSEEVVDEWESEWHHYNGKDTYEMFMAKQASRWGADQEFEACCEWLVVGQWFAPDGECVNDLRAARRPRPPSLKEQALEALDRMDQLPTAEDQHIIRRALETLPS